MILLITSPFTFEQSSALLCVPVLSALVVYAFLRGGLSGERTVGSILAASCGVASLYFESWLPTALILLAVIFASQLRDCVGPKTVLRGQVIANAAALFAGLHWIVVT